VYLVVPLISTIHRLQASKECCLASLALCARLRAKRDATQQQQTDLSGSKVAPTTAEAAAKCQALTSPPLPPQLPPPALLLLRRSSYLTWFVTSARHCLYIN